MALYFLEPMRTDVRCNIRQCDRDRGKTNLDRGKHSASSFSCSSCSTLQSESSRQAALQPPGEILQSVNPSGGPTRIPDVLFFPRARQVPDLLQLTPIAGARFAIDRIGAQI